MRFNATIESRTFKITNLEAFKEYLMKFNEGEKLILTLEKLKKTRSNQQNRYYWGVVLPTISEATGHTVDELHEIFKGMFLPRQFINFKGKEIELNGSTAKSNSKEMTEYIDKIIVEAGSMGISIPPPDYAI